MKRSFSVVLKITVTLIVLPEVSSYLSITLSSDCWLVLRDSVSNVCVVWVLVIVVVGNEVGVVSLEGDIVACRSVDSEDVVVCSGDFEFV